jgi:membrane protease YdiL (CAAX protease family)
MAQPTPPPPPPAAATDLGVSLVLVLPLLVAYQLGLLLLDFRTINGVDLLTRLLLPAFGLKGYVVANLALIAVFIVAISRLGERTRRRPAALFVPVVVESSAYAAVLGTAILFVMQRAYLLGGGPECGGGPDWVPAIVLSIGAGVYEELVFRLLLLPGLAYGLAALLGIGDRPATALAALASAALFSAAHYVGPWGDVFRLESFAYRFLAGLAFAALFRLRGFAVAVYTHATYDVLVYLA